jgi:ankyrin repeat protein
MEDDAAAVARLLAAGADPNASVAGQNASGKVVRTTALIAAAVNGRLEAARLLLDAGADPSRVDGGSTTPLMQAALRGQLEVLRLLLARGAALDAVSSGSGGTAFHSACYGNQAACAEALARAGCDVGIEDNEGLTGRQIAEQEGHEAVVARLRALVAEQLQAAQAAAGSEREMAPPSGEVLSEAVKGGDGPAIRRLLAAGGDPNASVMAQRGPSGEVYQTTALCTAARHCQLEAARLLLDAGADPSLRSEGGTPLMEAAVGGPLEVLRLLLARGAALDAADPITGGTAGLDEGLLPFFLPQFSFRWRTTII